MFKDSIIKCAACDGLGVRVQVVQLGHGVIQQTKCHCRTCNGRGEVIPEKDRCKECNGAMRVITQPRRFTLLYYLRKIDKNF